MSVWRSSTSGAPAPAVTSTQAINSYEYTVHVRLIYCICTSRQWATTCENIAARTRHGRAGHVAAISRERARGSRCRPRATCSGRWSACWSRRRSPRRWGTWTRSSTGRCRSSPRPPSAWARSCAHPQRTPSRSARAYRTLLGRRSPARRAFSWHKERAESWELKAEGAVRCAVAQRAIARLTAACRRSTARRAFSWHKERAECRRRSQVCSRTTSESGQWSVRVY